MSFDVNENNNENSEISTEEFFPAVYLGDFKNEYSIPEKMQEKVLIRFLTLAHCKVCRELSSLKSTENIFPISQKELFIHAVCCLAKASVLKETQTLSRREVAENLAKTAEEVEDKYIEFAYEAINSILGDDSVYIGII